jgi:guanylate kinase
MVTQGKFREHKKFNGWRYGTTKDSFEKSDVFIFTPSGVKSLDVSDFTVVYFDISLKDRIERLSKRSDSDSVNSRIAADLMDFHNFSNYDILVTDPKFDPSELKSLILKNI